MASLAGTSIPSPSSQRIKKSHRGASFVMADGSVKNDLVAVSAKAEIALGWNAVTASELSAILTGYAALATATGTYTDHASTSWTVTQPEGLPAVDYDEINAAATRYRVALTLREV